MTWTAHKTNDGLRVYTLGAYRVEPRVRVSKKLARTGYGSNGESGYVVDGWLLFRNGQRVQETRTLKQAKDRVARDS